MTLRCEHCSMTETSAHRNHSTYCAPPFQRRLHEFNGKHPADIHEARQVAIDKIDTSKLKAIKIYPTIGAHLASLNLFREPDGSLQITVSGSSIALMQEIDAAKFDGRPIDYVERLIVEAAKNIMYRL